MSHEGRFYTLRDALCEPRPVQPRLPILIGGCGPNKTLRTTARYADLWNGYGDPPRIAEVSEVLRTRCDEVGRPFESIERTVTVHAVVRDTCVAALEAWAPIAERHGLVGRVAADGTDRGLTVGGSPDEVASYLDGYRAVGCGRGDVRVPPPVRPRDHRAGRRGPSGLGRSARRGLVDARSTPQVGGHALHHDRVDDRPDDRVVGAWGDRGE